MMDGATERSPLNAATQVATRPVGSRTQSRSWLAKIAVGCVLALGLGLVIYSSQAGRSDSTATASSTGQGPPPLDQATPSALINGSDSWSCGSSSYDAGFIKLANKKDDHYFYWFAESTSAEPSKDPLVLWLTGGPGASSMTALLTENGPCTVNEDLSTSPNAYAWTNKANVIWLDQPTGVGFSYSGSPAEDADRDEQDVGANIYWFLQGFLEKHPQFAGRAFFITGESYAGHYIPGAAHFIWQKNKQHSSTEKRINLQGIAIGNGHTDPVTQYEHNVDMALNRYNISLLSDQQISQMKADSVECIALTKQCQQAPREGTVCVDAQQCWNTKLLAPFSSAHRNSYDLRKPCFNNVQVGSIGVCGFNFSTVEKYLALPEVRTALHVQAVPKWVQVNADVMTHFVASGDFSFSYSSYVADLLNDDIRVLIYAGDADLVCNWSGNEAWTQALEWKGKPGFNAATPRPFITHDPLLIGYPGGDAPAVNAGTVRSLENFAFVRVYDAGHMVPTDQPAVALDMINKFFQNQAL